MSADKGTRWTPLVESLGAIAWRTLGRELKFGDKAYWGSGSLGNRLEELQWRELGYARSDRKELSKDSIAKGLDFCVYFRF